MAKVTLKNIKKVYDGDVTAVEDFNLEVADKEFVVLVGPSGCGKSTTLRMVAGLEDITEGELYIGGELMNNVPAEDRDIAMVFQSYALYEHITVYDNMAFSLKARKADKEEIDEKVREAAEILGITEFLERRPKSLSGGQRQRVAIGRAIVRDPKVFLMDEPLSNLDAKLRSRMRAELIKLRSRIDTTFIYVTHDQTEAMTLGERIVVMKDGRIQQTGTPSDVFERPKNLFVAGFIGTPQMNFFDARVEKDGDGYSLLLGEARFSAGEALSSALRARGFEGGAATLGVRPEHLCVTNGGPDALRGRVDFCEMMGSEIYLHASVLTRDCVVRVSTIGPCGRSGRAFKAGEEVFLTFDGAPAQLFDTETGDSLAW